MQQIALLACIHGESLRHISSQLLPSRTTIRRWFAVLKERHQEFSDALKSIRSEFGYHEGVTSFWKKCLAQMSLSKAMFLLNQLNVVIP
jgi:hypothetical protein